MTDHVTIARRYIDLWNERAAGRRRELLSENWTADASYVDPLMKGDGHDGVDALIAGVQQRFPDFKFKLIGEPSGYGDHARFHVRFSWGLGPDDVDVGLRLLLRADPSGDLDPDPGGRLVLEGANRAGHGDDRVRRHRTGLPGDGPQA